MDGAGALIRCDRIVTDAGVVDGFVRIRGGRIAAVGPDAGREPGEPVVDLRGCWLLPGLVDLHVHGAGGWDTYALPGPGDPDTAAGLARLLAACGTTAFWPTLATHRPEAMEAACRYWAARVQASPPGPAPGARILGIHLEGPFLNPARAGAQNADWMLPPSPPAVERLLAAGAGAVRRVTLAPELPGALAAARRLAAAGVLVAAGHTDASYEEMAAARAAGVALVNHAFNAMRGLHQREPGAAGAALDPALGLDCEVIADGLHVHPAILRVLWRLKGPERLAAVSDAVAAALLPPGTYDVGAFTVTVGPDGTSRLPDGTLAGATATLLDGVRVLVERAGLELTEAVRCAATVPARLAGVGDRKGRVRPGYDADLVAVDGSWRVRAVWVEGREAFRPGDVPPAAELVPPRFRGAAGWAGGG